MWSNCENKVKFIRNARLEQLELRLSRYRRCAFDRHTHATYSIGIVFEGRTDFYHRRQIEAIEQGSIALINPDEVHACNPCRDSTLSYAMFYVEPAMLQGIASALSGKDGTLPHFTVSFTTERSLFLNLSGVCRALAEGEDNLEAESSLYDALAALVERCSDVGARQVAPSVNRTLVEQGHLFLMENLYRPVCLQEMASHCGLSPYHFLREFRRQYGLPPHAYQLQQRIHSARKLLLRDEPIAQIAARLGFADQSHFTRKFKSFVGVTPHQYQLAAR